MPAASVIVAVGEPLQKPHIILLTSVWPLSFT